MGYHFIPDIRCSQTGNGLGNKDFQESETCNHHGTRFICPRQNEPRDFIFCCNGNGTNLVSLMLKLVYRLGSDLEDAYLILCIFASKTGTRFPVSQGEISKLCQLGPTSSGPRFPGFNFKLTLIEI